MTRQLFKSFASALAFERLPENRQWTWQTCSEFGFFQSAGGVESPFHVLGDLLDVNYSLQLCEDVYGVPKRLVGSGAGANWTVRSDLTNDHGGARGLGASRVLLPDGSIDPWHSLALTQPTQLNLTPVLIDEALRRYVCAEERR
ncbi:hypothetical protein N9L31_00040 [bacterium]|nr:hypothetical protein [bacterium]